MLETPGQLRKIMMESPEDAQLGGLRDCGGKLLILKLGRQKNGKRSSKG